MPAVRPLSRGEPIWGTSHLEGLNGSRVKNYETTTNFYNSQQRNWLDKEKDDIIFNNTVYQYP
jgi:hypothetical protein